jgi:hypothetical protein
MGGEVLKVRDLKYRKNFVPLPYRRVSYQPYEGAMTEAAICAHLLAREVYRRTDVVVLHQAGHEVAVARCSGSNRTRCSPVSRPLRYWPCPLIVY